MLAIPPKYLLKDTFDIQTPTGSGDNRTLSKKITITNVIVHQKTKRVYNGQGYIPTEKLKIYYCATQSLPLNHVFVMGDKITWKGKTYIVDTINPYYHDDKDALHRIEVECA